MMLPHQEQAVNDYTVAALPRIVVIDREGVIVQVITSFHEDFEKQLTEIIQALL